MTVQRQIGSGVIVSWFLFAAAAFTAVNAHAVQNVLPPARNLAADGKVAEIIRQPIIVLVSLAGCPHCEVVRRSHLIPQLREPGVRDAPIIRQVEMNGNERMIDFVGKAIRHVEFSRRYGVKLAPVVFFFAPNGDLLADPLVGAMIADFYGAYFDAALATARAKLQKPLSP